MNPNLSQVYGMRWGGQFIVLIPSLDAVIAIKQNIAYANAVNQSIAFRGAGVSGCI